MIQGLLEQGLREHRAGRLSEAKSFYEQVLVLQPRHPDALHLLGVVALADGDAARAADLIGQAIRYRGKQPAFHANLAQAYLALERYAEARAAFRRAAALDPREPRFAVGAANSLALQGRAAEAARELRAVTQRHPGCAPAWLNLGIAQRDAGRLDEAADSFRRAAALEPAAADAHNHLGAALHALGRFGEAEPAYRRALALQPDSEATHVNLASLLIDGGRFAEAEPICRQGLARAPASVELQLALGSARTLAGRPAAALDAFRAAAGLAPSNARALWSYGSTLVECGCEEAGMTWLERALALQPDAPDFRFALSAIHLSLGNLQDGWRQHVWRTARQDYLAQQPDIPPATTLPDSLSGRRVCLLREQGLGDELFFLRYAAALKTRGAEVVYRSHARLVPLLRRVATLDHVIGPDEPLPAADRVLLLGDLPGALGPFESTPWRAAVERGRAPAAHQYPRLLRVFSPELPPPLPLAPLPDAALRMRERLAALGPPPYLGVTWRAGTLPQAQRGAAWALYKQAPLDALGAGLRGVAGTVLALQRHPAPGEIARFEQAAGRPAHDLTALNEDLEAMLALLALIDDYIGVSNTNMHLRAGAGRTARVLVPHPVEWRWMIAGDTSPWFPGFRLYRQAADGGWDAALARLASELAETFG